MDILQYHQCLSSTAANGGSVTLETVVNGHPLPSLTDDQNTFIENAEGIRKKHSDRKSKLMELLWTTFSSDDKLRPFMEMVHPSLAPKMQAGAYSDNPMPMVCHLYDICGGVNAHYKLNILNEVMCYFVMKNAMLRDGSKPYKPGTFAMMIQTIFGVFHINGIAYSSTQDFNFKGGFASVLKEIWEGISENDPVYGTRSN
jgi:hypothetical protein